MRTRVGELFEELLVFLGHATLLDAFALIFHPVVESGMLIGEVSGALHMFLEFLVMLIPFCFIIHG